MTAHVTAHHLTRFACLYVRQSTLQQVFENTESTSRQYALRERARALGWADERIVVIDQDLGHSGTWATDRLGFQQLVAEVGLGQVGLVLGLEVSRLARNSSDWHHLLEICAVTAGLLLSYTFGVLYKTLVYVLWHVTPDFGFPQSAKDVVPFVLLFVIIGPVGEETFFRGYFEYLFKRPWLFLLLSSLVWAALHVDPVGFIPYLWTGLIFGYLRLRFQSFYPSLALHILLNVLALVLFFWT